jgi:hypothetical protein
VDAWGVKLKGALRRKSNEHTELGYAKITQLLKEEGWLVGARIVQRLRRELRLLVPAKTPKRRRQGVSTLLRPMVSNVGMSGREILFMTRRSEGPNCECSISSMSIPESACVFKWIGRLTL